MKPEITITDNPDCTLNLDLSVTGCSPSKGNGLRSLTYFNKVTRVGDAYVYLKVWKKVPRAVRDKVVLEYNKERLMKNSPKIV